MKKFFPISILLLGLIALGAGSWLTWGTVSFIRTAARAEGKVVDLESRRSRGSNKGRTYRPVFEFRDAAGATHRVTEQVGSRPPSFDRGEKVVVLYDPADPEGARIKAISTLWLVPGVITVVGIAVTLAGGYQCRKHRAKTRQQS